MQVAERRGESDTELGQAVDEAVRNHFGYRAERTRRELRELFRRGRISLAIGLAFAGACVVASNALVAGHDPSALREVASESLVIFGWVAMWRPLEIFLYDWWPVRRSALEFERLARMHTRVVCEAA